MGRTANNGKAKAVSAVPFSKKPTHRRSVSDVAVRRSHKAKEKRIASDTAVSKKRGRRSDWPTQELEFFESWLGAYKETKGSRDAFWSRFFTALLEKFPSYKKRWADEVSVESSPFPLPSPPPGSPQASSSKLPNPTPSVLGQASSSPTPSASNAADAPMDQGPAEAPAEEQETPSVPTGQQAADAKAKADDRAKLAALEKLTWEQFQKKSCNWFYNHNGDGKKAGGWQLWLKKKLSKPTRVPPHIPAYKLYMGLPEYSAKVDAAFEEQFLEDIELDDEEAEVEEEGVENEFKPDELEDVHFLVENWALLSNSQKLVALKTHAIALRCAVAKKLFAEEPEDVRKQVEKQNEDSHQTKVAESKANLAAGDSPEMKDMCQKNIVPLTEAWANDISRSSGMYVSVFIGKPPTKPGEKFIVESVHAGENKDGRTWNQHEREKLGKATKYFFSFLQSCPGSELAEPRPPKANGSNKNEKGGKKKKKDKGKKERNDGGSSKVSGPSGNTDPVPEIQTVTAPPTLDSSLDLPPTSGIEGASLEKGHTAATRNTPLPATPNCNLHPPPTATRESESLEKGHVATKEGGPSRDPFNPPLPKPRPKPTKVPSKPKKMSLRMRSRLVEYSSEEESEEGGEQADEDAEENEEEVGCKESSDKLNATGVDEGICTTGSATSHTFLTSFSPQDSGALFQDGFIKPDVDAGFNGQEPPPSPIPVAHAISHSSARRTTTQDDMDVDDDMGLCNKLPAPIAEALRLIPDGIQGEWMADALATLTGSESMVQQAIWQHLIHQFVVLQSHYSFANHVRQGLPAIQRPLIYKKWSKEGRKGGTPLPFPPLPEFIDGLWSWWRSLMPEWRVAVGERQLSRVQSGSWESLRYPGQNGLLLILVGLQWWYLQEATQGGSHSWKELAEDALWVVESIGKWEKENPMPILPPPSQRSLPNSTQGSSQKPRSSQRLVGAQKLAGDKHGLQKQATQSQRKHSGGASSNPYPVKKIRQ
ncbi:hypothetical protein VNI00_018473 [Paramarasmius palmivorus]|uniref:Uncharacterized protein n=1 Tax=Paramarasmius palmivorus TaxID=297713 RepID=A0AAW0AWP9_9AGAR